MFGGQAYENGKLTPSSGVILLLYAKGVVYQENINHGWWLWRGGADGKYLYITNVSTKSVLVADTATYTISAVIPLSIDGTIGQITGSGAIAMVAAH